MPATSDPYKILQVDPDAEPEVIRAAYRVLALKYHPDVATGSEDRMAVLNQAWGMLRDAEARAAYDRARAEALRPPPPPKPEPSHETRTPSQPVPPGKPSGSVLDFGRYAGWSLGQLATADPNYLEWLARTPIGRTFYVEIRELLASRATPGAAARSATATTERRRGRFRGR